MSLNFAPRICAKLRRSCLNIICRSTINQKITSFGNEMTEDIKKRNCPQIPRVESVATHFRANLKALDAKRARMPFRCVLGDETWGNALEIGGSSFSPGRPRMHCNEGLEKSYSQNILAISTPCCQSFSYRLAFFFDLLGSSRRLHNILDLE